MTAIETAPAKASPFTSFVSYIRSLFQTASPDAKELIEQVREMDAKRKALIEEGAEVRNLAKAIELRRDKAAIDFHQTLTPLAFMRLVDCEKSVLAVSSILSTGTSGLLGVEHAQRRFEAAYPHYRETLIDALDAMLEIAREALNETRESERERFSRMGQAHLDAEKSPIVAQARAVVYTFEQTRAKAQSTLDETIWPHVVPTILRYAPCFIDENPNEPKA